MTEESKEFCKALSKLQSELSVAKRNKRNPHFKSNYANLESVLEACREPLAENGFSVVQTMFTSTDGKPGLKTLLLHTSGESIASEVLLPVVKQGPQELGSCITYMRRYCLAAMVGITDGEKHDDDAESAEGRSAELNSLMLEIQSSAKTLKLSKDELLEYIKTSFNKTMVTDLNIKELETLNKWLKAKKGIT